MEHSLRGLLGGRVSSAAVTKLFLIKLCFQLHKLAYAESFAAADVIILSDLLKMKAEFRCYLLATDLAR